LQLIAGVAHRNRQPPNWNQQNLPNFCFAWLPLSPTYYHFNENLTILEQKKTIGTY
jgi:hypothetical protein